MRNHHKSVLACLALLALAGCGSEATLQVEDGTGPNPKLPPPDDEGYVPVVNIAPAVGWSDGEKPVVAEGMRVSAFADGLDHPRWLYVLPNGDVLVAETNAPERPLREELLGIKGWVMGKVMKRAGAAVPSANRITLLRDTDGDGSADQRSALLTGLNSPFGMALVEDQLYVANTDALVRFPYSPGATTIEAGGSKVADLPGGPLNHHWTKNVIASRDGSTLFVTVGSNSNIAEHGMSHETERAAILAIDVDTGEREIYASGLRNPNGLVWEPESGMLWTVVNERDAIGGDLVPDYMTSVRKGAFYGWPWSYYGQIVDERVKPPRPDLVATAIKPDYALGPHTASLGLALSEGARLPARFATGMFVGQHGSWNREPLSGYRVIFVPFSGGRPSGRPLDVLTGFVDDEGNARGRPVGVAVDKAGGLLVADDVGNVVWRVTSAE
ncbi:MAG TPA: sorbosone dehydrogenase family protein [Steroidobacteraceae bacterium]|nr:sorbosone dehydrogenase family protein [Steroidobacteraceae bacterium]